MKRKWETLVALRDQSWKQLTRVSGFKSGPKLQNWFISHRDLEHVVDVDDVDVDVDVTESSTTFREKGDKSAEAQPMCCTHGEGDEMRLYGMR